MLCWTTSVSSLWHTDAAPQGTAGESGWEYLTDSFIPVDGLTACCLGTGPVCGRKCILVGTQMLLSLQNTITENISFRPFRDLPHKLFTECLVQSFGLAHSLICVFKGEMQLDQTLCNSYIPESSENYFLIEWHPCHIFSSGVCNIFFLCLFCYISKLSLAVNPECQVSSALLGQSRGQACFCSPESMVQKMSLSYRKLKLYI